MKVSPGTPSYTYNDKDAWFRSPDWDESAQEEWNRRIVRARLYNRFQYRRIKGLSLLASGDPSREAVGAEMMRYVTESEEAPEFERVSCLGFLGHWQLANGHVEAAERSFRRLLVRVETSGNSSGTNGEEAIALAEILIAKGTPSARDEATALLRQLEFDPPLFRKTQFRLAVAHTRLQLLAGEINGAKSSAAAALNLAAWTDSGLRYHPDLGLVNGEDATIAWLRRVAAQT